jgi:hypothetical protein
LGSLTAQNELKKLPTLSIIHLWLLEFYCLAQWKYFGTDQHLVQEKIKTKFNSDNA